jgi:tetratricopeptide (TPR) repeat protein
VRSLLTPPLAAALLCVACARPGAPPPAPPPAQAERPAPSEEARAEAAALVAEARAAVERKHAASARPLLERATRVDPTNADAFALLAEYYWGAGRWDDALRAAERGREANPDHPAIQRTLARAYGSFGLDAEFEAAARRRIELGPLSPEDWMMISDLAYDRRRFPLCAESAEGAVRAVESADRATLSDADKVRYLDARRSRGICAQASGRATGETPAAATAPSDPAAAVRARRVRKKVLDATRLLGQNRATLAAMILEDALEAAPDDVDVQMRLAEARWRAGRREQAVEAATRALELEPTNTVAVSALAVYQRELEQWKASEAHLRRFAELSPGDAWPWNGLGLVGFRSGASALCIEGYERGLAETAKIDARLLPEQAQREQTEARDNLKSCRGKRR